MAINDTFGFYTQYHDEVVEGIPAYRIGDGNTAYNLLNYTDNKDVALKLSREDSVDLLLRFSSEEALQFTIDALITLKDLCKVD